MIKYGKKLLTRFINLLLWTQDKQTTHPKGYDHVKLN